MRRSLWLAAFAVGVATAGLTAPAVAGASPTEVTTTVVVTPADVTSGAWTYYHDNGGSGQFGSGPGTTPAGVGSFQFAIPSNGKVTLSTAAVAGRSLGAVDEVSYATYRASTSTIPGNVDPAINMEICAGGVSGSTCNNYTTLVWEPVYAYGTTANGNDPVVPDTWQTWNALDHTSTSYTGGWWSTRDIPGVCAFNCFVSLASIQAANPDAAIISLGVNVGHGPAGTFNGAVDALTLGLSGNATTYDFEPAPQTVTFTSTPPAPAYYGANYTVAATGSGSAPISYAIAPASSGVCSISGAEVTFTGVGTCTITASQDGDATHAPGQASQDVTVVKAPVTVSGSSVSRFGSLFARSASFTVTVKNAATGGAAAGVPVTVTVSPAISVLQRFAVSCAATTNSSGVASCSISKSGRLLLDMTLASSYEISTSATATYQAGTGTGRIS